MLREPCRRRRQGVLWPDGGNAGVHAQGRAVAPESEEGLNSGLSPRACATWRTSSSSRVRERETADRLRGRGGRCRPSFEEGQSVSLREMTFGGPNAGTAECGGAKSYSLQSLSLVGGEWLAQSASGCEPAPLRSATVDGHMKGCASCRGPARPSTEAEQFRTARPFPPDESISRSAYACRVAYS